MKESVKYWKEAIAVHGQLRDAEVEDAPVSLRASIAHRRLGRLLLLVGRAEPAEETFSDGVDIARELHRREPSNPLVTRELCFSLVGLAHVRCVRLELESAAVACDEALSLSRELASRDGATVEDGKPLLQATRAGSASMPIAHNPRPDTCMTFKTSSPMPACFLR